MNSVEIIERFEKNADPTAAGGMAKFGIVAKKVYGIKIPVLRSLAKEIGKNQKLSLELWDSNSWETRILAAMIGDSDLLSVAQMESWMKDFDSWEICDQCIMNLFEKHPSAWEKAREWSIRPEEFVKRAGFVMMARLAVSDKNAADERFEEFFPLIVREACDGRNMVKKAVNWALRQIGKRNILLHEKAVCCAREIQALDSKSARWTAADAIRELLSDAVITRLKNKTENGLS